MPVLNPVSPQAKAITDLFVSILSICGVIFLVVSALITYALVRFRVKREGVLPRQLAGNHRLEFAWTAIPLLLVAWMFVLTVRAMNRSDPLPEKLDPDLIVVGHQWWWEVRYPKSGVITANEIHLPVGRRWLLRLESADVIHDFWAPQLGRKVDAVPGHPNYIWLEADQAGTYNGACAEYCGTQHAWMRFLVIAQAPADFGAWQQEQLLAMRNPATPSAMRGAQLFQRSTCVNCHAINGSAARARVGPDLTHLRDRRTLAAGVLENTPANLANWLRNPQAWKMGSLMPNLHLTETQVVELVDYLDGSGPGGAGGGGRAQGGLK
jgi:cytochrome c oxidase subunit 2